MRILRRDGVQSSSFVVIILIEKLLGTDLRELLARATPELLHVCVLCISYFWGSTLAWMAVYRGTRTQGKKRQCFGETRSDMAVPKKVTKVTNGQKRQKQDRPSTEPVRQKLETTIESHVDSHAFFGHARPALFGKRDSVRCKREKKVKGTRKSSRRNARMMRLVVSIVHRLSYPCPPPSRLLENFPIYTPLFSAWHPPIFESLFLQKCRPSPNRNIIVPAKSPRVLSGGVSFDNRTPQKEE